MKRILKKNQGITLVALVITIIVLLILAGVAITTLSGHDNIITKAEKARDDYNEASTNEYMVLQDFASKMEGYGSEPIKTWEERGVTNFVPGATYSGTGSVPIDMGTNPITYSNVSFTIRLNTDGSMEGSITIPDWDNTELASLNASPSEVAAVVKAGSATASANKIIMAPRRSYRNIV